jgi:hypothetical protein
MIKITTVEGKLFYKALLSHYQSKIDAATATLTVYLNKPVGIGEHSELMEEYDKWISTLSDAVDKYDTVKNLIDADTEDDSPLKG